MHRRRRSRRRQRLARVYLPIAPVSVWPRLSAAPASTMSYRPLMDLIALPMTWCSSLSIAISNNNSSNSIRARLRRPIVRTLISRSCSRISTSTIRSNSMLRWLVPAMALLISKLKIDQGIILSAFWHPNTYSQPSLLINIWLFCASNKTIYDYRSWFFFINIKSSFALVYDRNHKL